MILQGDAQLTAGDFLGPAKIKIFCHHYFLTILRLFGIGLNYKRHAKEVGLKVPHSLFILWKIQGQFGYEDEVVVPHVCSDEIDYEVELAVVKEDVKRISTRSRKVYIGIHRL